MVSKEQLEVLRAMRAQERDNLLTPELYGYDTFMRAQQRVSSLDAAIKALEHPARRLTASRIGDSIRQALHEDGWCKFKDQPAFFGPHLYKEIDALAQEFMDTGSERRDDAFVKAYDSAFFKA